MIHHPIFQSAPAGYRDHHPRLGYTAKLLLLRLLKQTVPKFQDWFWLVLRRFESKMFETPKLELKNTAKVSCVFNYHKFYNQFPSPKNALKNSWNSAQSLLSFSMTRCKKAVPHGQLGMDISLGWNSTVQRNNGFVQVFLSIESMENLGVETVGETWGWFQLRPLLKYVYVYIYIIIYIYIIYILYIYYIYIYFAAGARYYHSHINSWVKSTPHSESAAEKWPEYLGRYWNLTSPVAQSASDKTHKTSASCLDYGPASHKPIGRRTSPADLSQGGPSKKTTRTQQDPPTEPQMCS